MLNADLHSHSCVSDGLLTPEELSKRAYKNGVELWALTDHDELGGITRARESAAGWKLDFVPGVEISVTWSGQTIHIVGLMIDETNPDLITGLAATRGGRESRAHEMAAQLAHVGIENAFEGASRFAANPDLISRTHFARYLIEIGVCQDIGDVFKNYLIEGKPGYVPHHWASLTNAISWISRSGGSAVMAHPGRYPINNLKLHTLLDEFKQLGGCAIEVVTGSHNPAQYQEFASIARHYNFMASRGSDFHAPHESKVDLGKLPNLPDDLLPIWQMWL